MGIILFSVQAVNSDSSRIAHHAPVIQMIKKTIQLFRKKVHKRSDDRAAVDTWGGLIMVYRTHHQPISNIEMNPIRRPKIVCSLKLIKAA
jgi:hypothetical protein